MLKVNDVKDVGRGIADKTVGLVFEVAGTVTGNDRLKQAGRDRQDAGTERLTSVEEEAKATSRAGEARAQESRQRAHQPVNKRSFGRPIDEQDNAAGGVAEKAKGVVKKGVATVTGNEEMKAEADAQQEKGHAQTQAAKHEAKAELHEKKADIAYRSSEAQRKSS